MAECNIITQGGGGRPYGTLSEQIDNFTVTPGDRSATLTWTLPPSAAFDPHFVRVDIVRKAGRVPTKYRDGDIVYSGSGTTYTDTYLTVGTTYYYRAFAVNAEGEIQTAERIVSLKAVKATYWEKWSKAYATHDLGPRIDVDIGGMLVNIGQRCECGLPGTGTGSLFGIECSAEAFLSNNPPIRGCDYVRFVRTPPEPLKAGVTYYLYSRMGATQCSLKEVIHTYCKGDQSYGEVVDLGNPNAYPENGVHTDGYWYIKKG